jgi:glycosyltransferase involved in cell wall biosynthesis
MELSNRINFLGTVYNSVNISKIPWNQNKDDFHFFAGRVNWEKGLDCAIRVNNRIKEPLVMAIKMSEMFERDFYRKNIKPLINKYPDPCKVEIHEGLNRNELYNYYRRAKCTLFTSQWDEPFGLVMIESMASGTPVVGLRRGSVPEIVLDGKTGYVVDTEDEMIDALQKIDHIKPEDCRKHVETMFSRERMVENYMKIYEYMLKKKKSLRYTVAPTVPFESALR